MESDVNPLEAPKGNYLVVEEEGVHVFSGRRLQSHRAVACMEILPHACFTARGNQI